MNQPGIPAAILAGLLSFLSPCVLPLVPAYLSFISGTTVADLEKRNSRARVFVRSIAFSLGFTTAFTAFALIFSGSAMFLGRAGASQIISLAGGIIIILLGLNLIFDFIKLLGADTRLIGKFTGKKTHGIAGSFILGLAFSAGWSPCIGPILASILLYAGRDGNLINSALLLVAYSSGFAIPFIATGLFFDRLKPVLGFFKKQGNKVRIVSGLVLVLFGFIMAFGNLSAITGFFARLGASVEEFSMINKGLSKAIAAVVYVLLSVLIALPSIPRRNNQEPRKLTAVRIVFFAVIALAFAAEMLGWFSLLAFSAKWLSFSGL